MITAHIVGNNTTSPLAPVWESLCSVSGFCDHIVVHDFGMPCKCREVVDHFGKTKRDIELNPRETPMTSLGEFSGSHWVYAGFIDEVVHEDLFNYFWNVTRHRKEFLAIDVPVHPVFGTWEGTELMQTRLVANASLQDARFDGDGVVTEIPESARASVELAPAAIWKLMWAFPGDPSMSEYEWCEQKEQVVGVPNLISRLVGRHAYSLPYNK